MKIIVVMFLLLWATAFPVSAQTGEEIYYEGYEITGADQLDEALPPETERFLEDNSIELSKPDWYENLTGENVFKHIWQFIKSGASAPFKTTAAVIAIVLIAAAFPALGDKNFETASFVACISVAAACVYPVWNTVTAAVSAIKGCSTFMLSFVPVFAVAVSLSGRTASAVSMSALLLAAAETVSSIASFTVLPIMGCFLAISICSACSPSVSASGIAELIKKVTFWFLSLVSTVFVGILGIQSTLKSSADTLALKTTKYIVGTTVPVAGPALAETAATVTAAFSLLRSSVGLYGVVALAAILLPVIAELIIWRLCFALIIFVTDMFSVSMVSKIIKAVDTMLSLLVGVTLLVGAMFIISLTVVVGQGGGL